MYLKVKDEGVTGRDRASLTLAPRQRHNEILENRDNGQRRGVYRDGIPGELLRAG
jgi:hypothetical protein